MQQQRVSAESVLIGEGVAGPVQDVTYEMIWLIESDDASREA